MTFQERAEKFLSEYNQMDSDMERFDYITDMGIRMASTYAPDEADRIEGCDSGLWLKVTSENGRIAVQAVSDALYVNGIAALICRLADGLTVSEAALIDTDFPKKLTVGYPMTKTRLSGIEKMLVKIKEYAKNLL